MLITGGTGSFGRKFIAALRRDLKPRKIIVFSRDELKQHEMRVAGFDGEELRYFLGDVRDADRLRRAMQGVNIVVHAAALKQVPACEYNPFEAILTNVNGAKNIIDAAIDTGVEKVWRSRPIKRFRQSIFMARPNYAPKSCSFTAMFTRAKPAQFSVACATATSSAAAAA